MATIGSFTQQAEALLWRGGFSRLLTLALTEAWVRRWTARLEARSR